MHKLDEKALAARRLELWFFRDLSDDQRLLLFALLAMPVDEIGRNHGRQQIVLKRVLSDLAAAPSPAPVAVKALEWQEITQARSNEDPTHEPTGDLEATTPFGPYYITMYLGSDGYGWSVAYDCIDFADKDDPEDAKAAAQADYDRRIRSALVDPVADEAGGQT